MAASPEIPPRVRQLVTELAQPRPMRRGSVSERSIKSNRDRMRYPEFHEQGFRTATGVVEAGCKVVIATRLKRAGMHWTVSGANAIIALRCCKLSGRYEDFWERRSERSAA